MTAALDRPTWLNQVSETLSGRSFAELDALSHVARLAAYLTFTKTDPARLKDCLEVLRPLLELRGEHENR